MRIVVTSVLVDDQEKALRFYTDVLGFEKKDDIAAGGGALAHRRLAAGSATGRSSCSSRTGTRRPARSRRRWSRTASRTRRSASTTSRPSSGGCKALGVRFTQEPLEMGPVTTAVFDDTCGNLIQIAQRA